MGYVYAEQRPRIFTEEGQRVYLAVRDAARELLAVAGAARVGELIDASCKKLGAIDTWEALACIEHMKETGWLMEVGDSAVTQHRVFVSRAL